MSHGAMDHAGMDHGTMSHAPATPWKRLDARDPLYPCTAVAEKYQEQCYLIQTAAILPRMGGRIPQTARACSRAPAAMVEVCYRSLGRDLTAFGDRDAANTAALCRRAGEAALQSCIEGAAAALADVSQQPADGLALCRIAPDATRPGCYAAVSTTLLTNTPDRAAREAFCAALDEPYRPACRVNARLTR